MTIAPSHEHTTMNITGLEALWFGVDDPAACRQYLIDDGLRPTDSRSGEPGERYQSLDGSAVLLAQAGDPGLPPFPGSTGTLRKTVYGVADDATLSAIEAELSRGVGPFLRPAGSPEHHCLFFIQTPPHMLGCDHFAFHLGGPSEVLQAGSRFVEKGYQSFWGPGRHLFGSNWFWYFNSPLGCRADYDADMDMHDDDWVPRTAGIGTDSSQAFLFQYREKWAPGPGPERESVHGKEAA